MDKRRGFVSRTPFYSSISPISYHFKLFVPDHPCFGSLPSPPS